MVSIICTANASSYQCFGTEPFWSLESYQSSFTFELMGERKQQYHYDQAVAPQGMQKDFISIFIKKDTPLAIIQQSTCNDGMSDNTYTHQVILFLDQNYYGCCTLSKGSETSWAMP